MSFIFRSFHIKSCNIAGHANDTLMDTEDYLCYKISGLFRQQTANTTPASTEHGTWYQRKTRWLNRCATWLACPFKVVSRLYAAMKECSAKCSRVSDSDWRRRVVETKCFQPASFDKSGQPSSCRGQRKPVDTGPASFHFKLFFSYSPIAEFPFSFPLSIFFFFLQRL